MRRKPDEGYMMYNQRTAQFISRMFVSIGRKPIFITVLELVFKQAWREKTLPANGNFNYLRISREYRNRCWWKSIKDIPSQHAKERLTHVGMGPRCEWEDILCMVFGTD